jgi:hypothetical protein
MMRESTAKQLGITPLAVMLAAGLAIAADVVWDAIGDTVVAARKGMEFLKACAQSGCRRFELEHACTVGGELGLEFRHGGLGRRRRGCRR